MNKVILSGDKLTVEQLWAVAHEGAFVEIAEDSKQKVQECEKFLQEMVDSGEAIYGVTTGIGEFARIRIKPELGEELQKRIIYSHAAGVGDYFSVAEVRAAMLCRCNTLTKGYSGIRLVTLQTFVDMINNGIAPMVNEKGSVGTSGDLSPMSQIAEVVIGEGKAMYKGEVLPGKEVLKRAGIEPVRLHYKEGLALINGSQMMTGGLALLIYQAERIFKEAVIASSMTIDALRSVEKAFDARVHNVRPFEGQRLVAKHIRTMTDSSEIMAMKSGKVQDGYSLRCTPQVLGPSLDALKYCRKQVETEINSAADNPLFFPKDGVHLAAGNFHGQNIAIAADLFGIAMAEIADLSERHTNRLLNPALSGLPDFLVEGKGLNSGLMVAQYTAAALVSENKVLAHPASVDSISVSADQEDHVSMGPIGVRKGKEILKNTTAVIAIELMSACQAFDFRKPLKPGKGCIAIYELVRQHVKHLEDDRVLYPDIEAINNIVKDFTVLKKAESIIGEISLSIDDEIAETPKKLDQTDLCECKEKNYDKIFNIMGVEIRGKHCPECSQYLLDEKDFQRMLKSSTPSERPMC